MQNKTSDTAWSAIPRHIRAGLAALAARLAHRSRFHTPAARALSRTLLVALPAIFLAVAPSALALNPERHYELVSPVYKGGFGVGGLLKLLVSQDGERAVFTSPGAFAGDPAAPNLSPDYLAKRGPSGWETRPITPPTGLLPALENFDFSPTLQLTLRQGTPGASTDEAEQIDAKKGLSEFMLHDTDAEDSAEQWAVVGGPIEPLQPETQGEAHYVGADQNFCHIVFSDNNAILQEAEGANGQLYEQSRGCDGEVATLRLLSATDQGKPIDPGCQPISVGNEDSLGSAFNAIADNGAAIFFTACFKERGETREQLFVRLGGSRTVEISKALSEPDECSASGACSGAALRPSGNFVGASEDGSHVYFFSAAPLTGNTSDHSQNLYVATLGCGGGTSCQAREEHVTSLTEVSKDPNGGEAGVQGVLRVAPDGSRAYFVARGDLLTAAQRHAHETEARTLPRVGADNLYVSSLTGEGSPPSVEFIGDLCSGPELSGEYMDPACPSEMEVQEGHFGDTSLWFAGNREVQTAGPNARFLLFTSYARLVANDTNTARDVYRYDAVTGLLSRISVGEVGYGANGNTGGAAAQIAGSPGKTTLWHNYGLAERAISEGGSRVAFTTSRSLSPDATNHLDDVYEWHATPSGEGEVSLISAGDAIEPISPEDVVMSASGRDLMFVTAQSLLPQDTDTVSDVYDARLGENFPQSPASPQPCSGDACQGPLTPPAAVPVPATATQAPGVAASTESTAIPTKSVKKRSAAKQCRKGYVKKKNRCVRPRSARKAHSGRGGHR